MKMTMMTGKLNPKIINYMKELEFKDTLYRICLFCPVHLFWTGFSWINETWEKLYEWKKYAPTSQRVLELIWWVYRKVWQWFLHAWAKKTSLLAYAEYAKHQFKFQMSPQNELDKLLPMYRKILSYNFLYGLGKDLAQETPKECETK